MAAGVTQIYTGTSVIFLAKQVSKTVYRGPAPGTGRRAQGAVRRARLRIGRKRAQGTALLHAVPNERRACKPTPGVQDSVLGAIRGSVEVDWSLRPRAWRCSGHTGGPLAVATSVSTCWSDPAQSLLHAVREQRGTGKKWELHHMEWQLFLFDCDDSASFPIV